MTSGEDIPLAQRTSRPLTRPRSPLQRIKWLLIGGLGAATVLVGLMLGPLRNALTPAPVPGLDARLDSDGRLLGHFPYAEATDVQLQTLPSGLRLRPPAAAALLAMQRAAAADGIDLVLLSAFRDWDLQNELFFEIKSERAQVASERAKVSAPPGFSEHHTGYAVDLGDGGRADTHLQRSFETTPAFRWLQEHAARHHFRLSFTKDNDQGVSYEPWHWRYEGSTDALELFEPSQRLSR